MDKPAISTKKILALKFFTAHGGDNDKESLCLFKSASFDTSTGM